jgi:hypothetical protein
MKALSIRQPWAWLIANGHKDVENRNWRYAPTFRGSFLIHAGKRFGGPHRADEWHWLNIECPDTFELGGVIGIAVLVDVVTRSKSPWFTGPLGFVLRNARPLPFFPCNGMLGFFEIEYPRNLPALR